MYTIGNCIFGVAIDEQVLEKLQEKLKELDIEDDWDLEDPDSCGCTTCYSGTGDGVVAFAGYSFYDFAAVEPIDLNDLVSNMPSLDVVKPLYEESLDSLEPWAKDVISTFEPKFQILWSDS